MCVCESESQREREERGQAELTYIAKRESIASLKLTRKHTFTEKLCHPNLAEFAVCAGAYVCVCAFVCVRLRISDDP